MFNFLTNKYAIIGGRDFNNYQSIKNVMAFQEAVNLIISGGARGADSLGLLKKMAFHLNSSLLTGIAMANQLVINAMSKSFMPVMLLLPSGMVIPKALSIASTLLSHLINRFKFIITNGSGVPLHPHF